MTCRWYETISSLCHKRLRRGNQQSKASAAHLGLRTQWLLELLQVVRLEHLDGDILRDLETLAQATLCGTEPWPSAMRLMRRGG